MKPLKLTLAILLNVVFLFQVNGQSKEVKKILRQADKYYDSETYKTAAKLYKKVIAEMKDDAEVNLKLGHSLLRTIDKRESLPYFEKAYKIDPEVDERIALWLARAYHINHKFDKALKYYTLYETSLGKRIDDEVKDQLDRYEYECKVGKELIGSPIKVSIDNIGPVINSKYPDYVPVISADKSVMVFTSRRENSTGGELVDDDMDGHDDGFYEDLYITYFVTLEAILNRH